MYITIPLSPVVSECSRKIIQLKYVYGTNVFFEHPVLRGDGGLVAAGDSSILLTDSNTSHHYVSHSSPSDKIAKV